jgi:nucleoside-triphosphatase THEP1
MFAEVVGAAGSVIVRAEGYVAKDDDITALAQSAVDRYRRANPDTSLIDEIGVMGFTIRFAGAAASEGPASLIRRFAL